MSKVEKLFRGHIAKLRKDAHKNQISIIELLQILSGKKHSLGEAFNADAAESELVNNYRTEFFEMIANAALEWDASAIEKMADDKARQLISATNKRAADHRHSQPGGSHDKRKKIRAAWATGKYRTHEECAEKEHDKLGMSPETARKALRKAPTPESRASARKG